MALVLMGGFARGDARDVMPPVWPGWCSNTKALGTRSTPTTCIR
jgi:hypothetical protein